MSADPIIYCLERLTDYRQFERLCSDVMATQGYATIEPLGGSADRGRDAIYRCLGNDTAATVFAYSVRADWRRKLLSDCARLREENHVFGHLVFVSTSVVSASEKDATKADIESQFGWQLEIYDIERLRVVLTTGARHLVARHTSIFSPPWFETRGGLSLVESRDTLVIDHVQADHALASWLARRLQLAGFPTWSFGTAPLAGEDADASVRLLIERRASRYLPILSTDALRDANLMARCGIACNQDGLTIPCSSESLDRSLLSSSLQQRVPVRFDESWQVGLGSILDALHAQGVAPSLDEERARVIALRSYVPEPVIRSSPERVFGNVFKCTLPPAVQVCLLDRELSTSELPELRKVWAFVEAAPTKLLAFADPPADLPMDGSRRRSEYSWDSFEKIEGLRAVDLVKQLIRRSLDVACYAAGLHWCNDREVLYFPHNGTLQQNLSYQHVDGRNTWVGATGEKQYGTGDRASRFRYQLSPSFRIGQDERQEWWVTTRIYVRVTDQAGIPFVKNAVVRRRKVVTKNWWNKEWFARLLAVMQALSAGEPAIRVGSGHRRLLVSTKPLEWACPISIDLDALERVGDFQEEMAALRYAVEEDDEEVEDIEG